MTTNKKFWEVKAEANKIGSVYIYGGIYSYKWDDEDVTAKSFKEDLDALGDIDTLNIYINSPGGAVFQAQAIHTQLKRHKATKNVYIDGLAASAASFIAMAGDKVYMPKNASFMIHLPMTGTWGNVKDLQITIEMLNKVLEGMIAAYMSHTGDKLTRDKLVELLEAESWLTAQECYDYGFIDEIIDEKQVAACADPEIINHFKNVPDRFRDAMKGGENTKDDDIRSAIVEKARYGLECTNQINNLWR